MIRYIVVESIICFYCIWFTIKRWHETISYSFSFIPEHDAIYFSYFIPYSMERHHDLVANAVIYDHCSHELLGKSLDGQDMDLLRFSFGDAANKKTCWIIARQHPGETMAEWWMEGCI